MEGNITHTAITSYGYSTLRLKKGPNLPGPIFPTLPIFRTVFILINYYLRDPIYICPQFFNFWRPHFATPIRDLISRLTFATHVRDSRSRLPFTTPISDSRSRLPFATRVRDYTSDSHSRLAFATTLATPVRDSRSRPQMRLAIFLSRPPSCDSTTDGRTVLTPQRHLPSVPTLTLIKNFGTYSLAWPPPLATTHHHVQHPQWPCVP